jgi:hypothetical protein
LSAQRIAQIAATGAAAWSIAAPSPPVPPTAPNAPVSAPRRATTLISVSRMASSETKAVLATSDPAPMRT